jgi:predicted carbohydrate-binding protein with CBM48
VLEHEDELISRIAAQLRVVAPLDEAFDARVMADIATLPPPAPGRLTAAAQWLRRPRTFRVSPLAGLALAAALGAILLWRGPRDVGVAPTAEPAAAPGVVLARHGSTVVQFVLVAPSAKSVALVGDFNDWDAAATPLRADANGAWLVALRLIPGRHRYAFVLDGVRWIADPAAPPAPDDDFGSPGSVVTVGA